MAQTVVDDGLSMMERLEKTGSFLPRGVAHAISVGRNGLKFVTYAELKEARIQRQAEHLKRVLAIDTPTRRAAYVWTFFCPGVGGFAYRGWWAYLWTIKESEKLDPQRCIDDGTILRVMTLFPCGMLPCPENFEEWKEAFGREFARPGRFKKQGLAKVWIRRKGWGYEVEPA